MEDGRDAVPLAVLIEPMLKTELNSNDQSEGPQGSGEAWGISKSVKTSAMYPLPSTMTSHTKNHWDQVLVKYLTDP